MNACQKGKMLSKDDKVECILRELQGTGVAGYKHIHIDGTALDTVENNIFPEVRKDLYAYQLDVIEKVKHFNVFVNAPTGSGKTLAFALSYAVFRMNKPNATMLVVYPRKALARDQIEALKNIYSRIPSMRNVLIMPYDGDVDSKRKAEALMNADVIVSNFYGLHLYMARHGRWDRFLSNLALVVIDEAHMYNGVFGTHVSYVIRRINRLANIYGAHPKFLLLTATVGSPEYSGSVLVGEKFVSVEVGHHTMLPKELYFIGPLKGKKDSFSERESLLILLKRLINLGHRGMVFFNSRDELERLYYYFRKSKYAEKILPYRAGYSSQDRRSIESKMREGKISFLFTTSAMELGIDIGDIDVVVLYGFPNGGFSSFWQRAGRAGRRNKGYVFSILRSYNALDMYVYDHPDIVLSRKFEPLFLDITNTMISKKHLACAFNEYPLEFERDVKYFGRESIFSFLNDIYGVENEDHVKNFTIWVDKQFHSKVSLDEGDDTFYYVLDITTGNKIEEVELWRVLQKHYPGSIYFYMGTPYISLEIDMEENLVKVFPLESNKTRKRSSFEDDTLKRYGWFDIVDVDSQRLIGREMFSQVVKSYYPGNVVGMRDGFYIVVDVSFDNNLVRVKPYEGEVYANVIPEDTFSTTPVGWENIKVLSILNRKVVGNREIFMGKLEIEDYTIGYSTRNKTTYYNAAIYRKFVTKGVWFNVYRKDLNVDSDMILLHIPINNELLSNDEEVFAGALHTLEHVLIKMLPVISILPEDVGGYSIPSVYQYSHENIKVGKRIYISKREKQIYKPKITIDKYARVYIYDGHPEGIGIAERIFEKFEDVVKYAAARLDECECEKGCPACIMSHKCGNGNKPLNKLGGQALLKTIFLV